MDKRILRKKKKTQQTWELWKKSCCRLDFPAQLTGSRLKFGVNHIASDTQLTSPPTSCSSL